MGILTALVRRHPVLAYFALTFAISWGGVLLVIARSVDSGVKAHDSPLFPLAVAAMVAGPSLTALLLTALIDGTRGLSEFAARLMKWRVSFRWYALGLSAAPLASTAAALMLSPFSPEFRPGIIVTSDKAALLLLGLGVGTVAGLFEELGWTGFAIPRLKRTHGVIATGVIIGLVWSAWHILVVAWGIGGRAGGIPLSVFIAVDGLTVLPAFRVLMVWLYERTESLFLGILMHASLTATILILAPLTSGTFLLANSVVFAGVLWLVIGVASAVSAINRPAVAGTTPPFRRADGTVLPGSIAEVNYLRIGDVDQWVMIRGENVANPPLICLHGGPGFSDIRLFRQGNSALERIFTLVFWDQRGAGRSFDPAIPRSSMTVDQFIADLDELVDAVRIRLGHQKVVIFGHSWGTLLGVMYAARFPEKVLVYVGGAQIGDWRAAESAAYSYAVAEAQRRSDRRALKSLRTIGAPPYDADAVFKERMCVSRMEGQQTVTGLWKLGRMVLGNPEVSIRDVPDIVRGFRFSMRALWPEVSALNLLTLVPELRMPVFFFLGSRDRWVPPHTSVAYYDVLVAPIKQLVWFENSAHEMFVDQSEKFNSAMANLVRPVVDAELAELRFTGEPPAAATPRAA